MQRHLAVLAIPISFSVCLLPAQALLSRTVYIEQVSRGLEVKVWGGYGLALNFTPTHGIIKHAWLGHPGYFTLSSNGRLCPQSVANQEQDACQNTGATSLYLQTIYPPVNLPGMAPSPDGGTQLTVDLEESDGEMQEYQVQLEPGKGKPEYTAIVVEPNSAKPAPLFVHQQPVTLPPPVTTFKQQPGMVASQVVTSKQIETKVTNPAISRTSDQPVAKTVRRDPSTTVKTQTAVITSPLKSTYPQPTQTLQKPDAVSATRIAKDQNSANTAIRLSQINPSIKDANAVAFGLRVANQKGEIRPNTKTWSSVQDAIRLLRRGYSREKAADIARLKYSVLLQLIQWGQNRP